MGFKLYVDQMLALCLEVCMREFHHISCFLLSGIVVCLNEHLCIVHIMDSAESRILERGLFILEVDQSTARVRRSACSVLLLTQSLLALAKFQHGKFYSYYLIPPVVSVVYGIFTSCYVVLLGPIKQLTIFTPELAAFQQ